MLYDEYSIESILNYSKHLEGKTLREVFSSEVLESMRKEIEGNKGKFGQILERYFFGYECNSDSEPDFPCGLELKVTPLKKLKNGTLSPKERLVCNIINFENIINESWEESSFLKKNQNMLVIQYIDPLDKNIDRLDYKIVKVFLHNINHNFEHIEQFKQDWNTIVSKIKDGKAHKLSESDTKYLGACTKGAKAATSFRKQPNSEELAKQRAFSFKTKYMKSLI
ncbi:MutH/Sau3AI family endonuclease [Aliarcobacter cryaerophilus]|uniref:MutH/Sau3AI family endonuclease n=1 Tax=Aliarcobacter cryaerophilus TaxID=28198 RepID=UPI0016544FF7|nr:MutH/Sau3AI family endonuclease [Aliarcobacter cryaerophilus]QNM91957.1 hypothetical protein HOO33_08795 [Aliarcobacter cryaerophilus]